jgi:hypothetical protein
VPNNVGCLRPGEDRRWSCQDGSRLVQGPVDVGIRPSTESRDAGVAPADRSWPCQRRRGPSAHGLQAVPGEPGPLEAAQPLNLCRSLNGDTLGLGRAAQALCDRFSKWWSVRHASARGDHLCPSTLQVASLRPGDCGPFMTGRLSGRSGSRAAQPTTPTRAS